MDATREARERGWVDARPVGLVDALVSCVRLPRVLFERRELLIAGVRRDLGARFSGTVLGRVWPLVSPLLLFGVYYFLFTRIFGFRLEGLDPERRGAMGVYMFVGALAWTGFAEGVTRASTVLVENGTLIKKLAFPSELLPLQVVLASAVTQLIGFGVFAVVATVASFWPAPGVALLWIPVILALQLAFTYGLALLVSAANVFLRDVASGLSLVMTVWMFATPVFWMPVREVLPAIGPWLPWIERNPLYSLCYAWRAVWMSSAPTVAFPHTIGSELLAFAPWAVGAYVVGATCFALVKRRFADEV
ncbi:MAG: ABC transporter permease [Planctomycetes bacterium]|nr:ABC transporter permease [Planctomycetota bacterium]